MATRYHGLKSTWGTRVKESQARHSTIQEYINKYGMPNDKTPYPYSKYTTAYNAYRNTDDLRTLNNTTRQILWICYAIAISDNGIAYHGSV